MNVAQICKNLIKLLKVQDIIVKYFSWQQKDIISIET